MIDPARAATIVHLLEARAQGTAEAAAIVMLDRGEDQSTPVSYRELHAGAGRIAAALSARQLRDRTVLLLYPSGVAFFEAFLGCLQADVIAVPATVPHRRQGSARLEAIARDCDASLILTTAEIGSAISAATPAGSLLAALPTLSTDAALDEADEGPRPQLPSADAIAFLQYTSGSTANPRGAVITHGNLMANQRIIRRATGEMSATVSWLPLFHDFGLIGSGLQPIYQGAPLYLMAPGAFLQRPLRWLTAIARTGASHAGAPNFAYDLCVDRTTADERRLLDLRGWRSAVNGAEPVRAETLRRFHEAFRDSGFSANAWQPSYGLAEATLMVTGGPPQSGAGVVTLEDGGRSFVSVGSGRLHPEAEVTIVDPATMRATAGGGSGEIWLRGDTVAAGYWRRNVRDCETFGGRLADGSGPFLRTGDLGFLRDGVLHITGRIKDQLTVRGRTLHPHDIEQSIGRSHSDLLANATAVFAIDHDRREELIVAQEIRRGGAAGAAGLARHVRTLLQQEFGLAPDAIAFVPRRALPRTTSGKLQRFVCRDMWTRGEFALLHLDRLSVAAPPGRAATAAEPLTGDELLHLAPDVRLARFTSFLQATVAEFLGVSADAIDPAMSTAELGLDSIRVVELKYRLDHALGYDVDPLILIEPRPLTEIAALALAPIGSHATVVS